MLEKFTLENINLGIICFLNIINVIINIKKYDLN